MHPIYEDDDRNEFASAFGERTLSGGEKDRSKQHSSKHVHIMMPKWLVVSGLVVIILGVVTAIGWQFGWFNRALQWYSAASITITVIEKDTHHAIASASVTVGEVSAQTNTQGVASIGNLRSGKVLVTVSKPGYAAKTYETTLYRGDNPLADVVIEKAPDKTYSLKITVKDAIAGTAVKGAKIVVGARELSSSDAGLVSATLSAVVESVHITKDGYEAGDAPLQFAKDAYSDLFVDLFPIRYVVFEQEKGGYTDLYATDFKGSSPVRLTDGKDASSNTTPVASQDLQYVAFLSDRDGVKVSGDLAKRLYVLDQKGVATKTTDDLNPDHVQWISANTIIYSFTTTIGTVTEASVASYNLVTKKRTLISQAFQDPSVPVSLVTVAVSNNGQSVVYALNAGVASTGATDLTGIYTVQVDGTNRKKISNSNKKITDLYFASDGTTVRYTYADATDFFTYEASTANGEKDVTKTTTLRERTYTKIAPGNSIDPNLLTSATKTGTFVYVDTKNGKSDVFALASVGKPETQVTDLGTVSSMMLSADEKYILVAVKSTNSLYIAGIAGTTAHKIADAFTTNASFGFKPPLLTTP